MTQPPTSTPPAGWYDDPQNPGSKRWWDGNVWTNHVHPPAAPAAPGPAAREQVQPGSQEQQQVSAQHEPASQQQQAPAPQHVEPEQEAPARQPLFPDHQQEAPQQEAPQRHAAPEQQVPAQQHAFPAQQQAFPAQQQAPAAGQPAFPSMQGVVGQQPGAQQAAAGQQGEPEQEKSGRKVSLPLLIAIPVVAVVAAAAYFFLLADTGPSQAEQQAFDSSAKSDVSTLGRDIKIHFVDNADMPSVTTADGNYVVAGTMEIPISEGVALGEITGTGSADWCVDVVAVDGVQMNFRYSAQDLLEPGTCADYVPAEVAAGPVAGPDTFLVSEVDKYVPTRSGEEGTVFTIGAGEAYLATASVYPASEFDPEQCQVLEVVQQGLAPSDAGGSTAQTVQWLFPPVFGSDSPSATRARVTSDPAQAQADMSEMLAAVGACEGGYTYSGEDAYTTESVELTDLTADWAEGAFAIDRNTSSDGLRHRTLVFRHGNTVLVLGYFRGAGENVDELALGIAADFASYLDGLR